MTWTHRFMDFDIKYLPNIKFDSNELLEYFRQIEREFPHMKWTLDAALDTLNHNVNDVYSYNMQTNFKNNQIPCSPYHVSPKDGWSEEILDDDGFNNPTDLLFGITKRIVDKIPNVRQMGIACHPPGTRIGQHVDNKDFVKIHIPIQTTDKSYFSFGEKDYVMEVGKAYLVNTKLMHGTNNMGDIDRIHLLFKINPDDLNFIMNTEFVI